MGAPLPPDRGGHPGSASLGMHLPIEGTLISQGSKACKHWAAGISGLSGTHQSGDCPLTEWPQKHPSHHTFLYGMMGGREVPTPSLLLLISGHVHFLNKAYSLTTRAL